MPHEQIFAQLLAWETLEYGEQDSLNQLSSYNADVTIDDVIKFVQEHFTDGLVLVVGSGLSAAEGIPGMPDLADCLRRRATTLGGNDAKVWANIQLDLDEGEGLEAALKKNAPSATLEAWITDETCKCLLPREREVITAVVRGSQTLRLTAFLSKVLKPTGGLPILTSNYDRLVEVACEMAGFHVDTTAIGDYAAEFDYRRSCMRSCRGILPRVGKTPQLDHFPRAIVLKPHGSFDWYRTVNGPKRSSIEIDAERLMITPGVNKYTAGYEFPFDRHISLANEHIDRSARLLIIGYGFNDDHLQTHLDKRIEGGTPTLILTRRPTPMAQEIARKAPRCICLYEPSGQPGVAVLTRGADFAHSGKDIWDLGVLMKELLL
jgi:SIR2-like domain